MKHTMFTGGYFAPLAKLLPNLEDLHLASCHQLTTHDLWHFLLSNDEGFVRLDLDGLSPLFVRWGSPVLNRLLIFYRTLRLYALLANPRYRIHFAAYVAWH